MRLSRLVATFGGAGLLKPGPGTWGSAVAVPLCWVLHGLGGFPLVIIATFVFFMAGLWASEAEERATGAHDPGEIVIDEVVGQFLALWPLSGGIWFASFSHPELGRWLFPYPGWIGGFVMFRIFDIWKPWLVGRFDRMRGARGVMLDDVAAGLFAALVVSVAAAISHGLLMK